MPLTTRDGAGALGGKLFDQPHALVFGAQTAGHLAQVAQRGLIPACLRSPWRQGAAPVGRATRRRRASCRYSQSLEHARMAAVRGAG